MRAFNQVLQYQPVTAPALVSGQSGLTSKLIHIID
jgi:hypothetical protein